MVRTSSHRLQVYIFSPLVFQSSLPSSPSLPNGGSTPLKWPGRNLSPPCAGGHWVDLSTSGHACNLRLSRANAGSAATFPESWSPDLPSATHPSPVPLLNSLPATLGTWHCLTRGADPPDRPCLGSSHRPQPRGVLFERLKGGQGEQDPGYKLASYKIKIITQTASTSTNPFKSCTHFTWNPLQSAFISISIMQPAQRGYRPTTISAGALEKPW